MEFPNQSFWLKSMLIVTKCSNEEAKNEARVFRSLLLTVELLWSNQILSKFLEYCHVIQLLVCGLGGSGMILHFFGADQM